MSTPILVIAPSRLHSFADLILRFRGRDCAPNIVHSSSCRKLAQRFQGRRPKCLHQGLGCIHWRDKVGVGFHSPPFTQSLLEHRRVSVPLSSLMLKSHTLSLVGYRNASNADKRPPHLLAPGHGTQVIPSAALCSVKLPSSWRRRPRQRSTLDCRSFFASERPSRSVRRASVRKLLKPNSRRLSSSPRKLTGGARLIIGREDWCLTIA